MSIFTACSPLVTKCIFVIILFLTALETKPELNQEETETEEVQEEEEASEAEKEAQAAEEAELREAGVGEEPVPE